LLDEWAAMDYGMALSDLKIRLIEETELFKVATDILKEREREVIDYYASDLADIAVSAGHKNNNIALDAIGPETFTFDALVRLIASTIRSRA
jgi:hypothetical protein